MATWKYEALFVCTVLAATAVVSGGELVDWLGAAAVLITFMHGQISFDFQEAQGQMPQPDVSCYKSVSYTHLTLPTTHDV